MKLIEVKNLSVSFEGREIFKNINFTVEQGDYLCILGENGSGKTTLMQCMLGLDVKYSGAIDYNGFKNRDIGWLPQRNENKSDFPANVYEIVLSGFAGKGIFGFFYSKAQRDAALKNMELLDLREMKNRSFSELSGGEQQRVLLCRALCAADKVLLLDEPVTGLDTLSQNELYSIISRLNSAGITVIMITHDIDKAVSEADKILHIGDGDYFFGTAADYAATEHFRRLEAGE